MCRRGLGCASCVCILALGACENREPASLIESCIWPAVEHVRATGQPADVECDLKRESVLVAVPLANAGDSEFVALGLSAEVALMVTNRELPAPRWCSVEESPSGSEGPADGGKRLVARVGCVPSSVAIAKAVVVRARRVAASLELSGAGVTLTRLTAAESHSS
jgi:hypothetical protein